MSTTAQHVIELVRSLPEADQRAIRDALARPSSTFRKVPKRKLQRLAGGGYLNPDGIPNNDPVFKVLEQIEEERHQTPGPPAPEFD